MGDVARLRQILLNLLSNAVKFTHTGSVTVRTAWKPGDAAGRTGRLRLSVSDTGDGIEPEKVKRLFERFSQADISINRTHGGTGLGLAISKGIVELMGGRIGVTTRQGKGSTFWIEIPSAVGEAPAASHAPDVDLELPPLRVLVVDDTAVNRELVKLMLEPLGLVVEEASGGAEGIKAAVSQAYDLILMDVRMPGVDGLEAARVIRGASKLNGRTPILALTADVQAENAQACRAAGMDDVLAKPIVPRQLLSKIAEWTAEAEADPATAARR
jgi:CheY-like chemotaxis protein